MSSSNRRVFGQATRGPSRYQRQLGQRGKNKDNSQQNAVTEEQERAQRRLAMKLKRKAEGEALDERFGYSRYCRGGADGSRSKRGWVFNILPTVCLCYLFALFHLCTCGMHTRNNIIE